MNDMGPCLVKVYFIKTGFREKEDKLQVARVQHQVGFSLVTREEKLTVKQVTSWHLLLDHETTTFVLTIHSTMYEEKVDCGHFNI